MYPDKKISVLQMISALKDKKIKYKNDLRCDSVKGCFVGYSLKDEESSSALKFHGCTEKEKNGYIAEIERLKKELADLKKACNVESDQVEVKQTPKKIFKDDKQPSKSESHTQPTKGKMDKRISSLDDIFMNSLF